MPSVMLSPAWKTQVWSFLTAPSRRLVLLAAAICVGALIGLVNHSQEGAAYNPSFISPAAGYLPSTLGWGRPRILGQGEPVVFSLIVWGNETAYETDVLLKTILMYSSSPVDFHLIADPDSQAFLTESLSLVEKPVYDVRVYWYPISHKAMDERLKRTAPGKPDMPRWGELRTNHQSSMAGMMKLFFHEMLPDTVHRSIFLDSDAFFITDPTLLWKEFNTWGPEVAISIPAHEGRGNEYNGTTRICSCIILLDLDKLRNTQFIYSTLSSPRDQARAISHQANLAVYGEPTSKDGTYNRVGLGDQTYYMSAKIFKPEMFINLPLSWEVTSCLMHHYNVGEEGSARMSAAEQIKNQKWLDKTPYQGTLITPGVLHFNCMYGRTYMESPFFDDPKNEEYTKWLHAVRYHQHFKWIWLNKGSGDAAVTFENVTDVRFRDERIAGRLEPAGY